MHTETILGVRVHAVNEQQASKQLRWYLDEGVGQYCIFTPNPEILLYASTHRQYRDILNSADLSLPDGYGLRFVSGIRHRVTGADTANVLLAEANARKLSILAVIRADGRSSAASIQQAIQQKAPQATVHTLSIQKNETVPSSAFTDHTPDIILVGLGFPEQEQWLYTYLKNFPTARIGMAIGGTFDFWTGAAKRAPQWMRSMGVEWLWRLAHQPKRIIRIIQAVVIFPLRVLQYRFFHHD